jgi:hypothetical protein
LEPENQFRIPNKKLSNLKAESLNQNDRRAKPEVEKKKKDVETYSKG